MSDRSNRISRLLHSQKSRASYIKAKLGVLVPAQIRATRLRSVNPPLPRQKDLARETDLHQSRISMFETPGAANITLETLAHIAAGLKVGVIVKLAPFSEMLRWENSFSPSSFDVTPRLEEDEEFLAQNKTTNAEGAASCAESPSSLDNIASMQEPEDTEIAETKRPMGTEQFCQAATAGSGGR